jgi:hypothetical protein
MALYFLIRKFTFKKHDKWNKTFLWSQKDKPLLTENTELNTVLLVRRKKMFKLKSTFSRDMDTGVWKKNG